MAIHGKAKRKMSWFTSSSQPPPRPKRFIDMPEDERVSFAEMLEAKHPELKDTKAKETAIRRFILVLEETDPEWKLVFDFARRAFPQLFYPGRTPSPEAVSRSFRRLHERQGKKEEE